MAGTLETVHAIVFDPGFALLVLAVLLAGAVRGFSGFGTGLVYVPLAAQVLPPVWVLITILMIDCLGPLPVVPRALREGRLRDVWWLCLGAALGLPLGLWVLLSLPSESFRLWISLFSLGMLAVLITGIRYKGHVSDKMVFGTGALGGVLGGALALPGPPVILFYMSRPLPVAVIRANILLFLFFYDLILFGAFWGKGLFEVTPVITGLLLLPVYGSAVWFGAWIFDPGREVVYRRVAYVIIAGSALSGLPIWS